MSKAAPTFAGLKKTLAEPEAAPAADATEAAPQAATPPRPKQRGGRRPKPGGNGVAPARAEKKAVVGYFPPEVNKWLRQIALDEEKTLQLVLLEAINLLCRKHGQPAFPTEYGEG